MKPIIHHDIPDEMQAKGFCPILQRHIDGMQDRSDKQLHFVCRDGFCLLLEPRTEFKPKAIRGDSYHTPYVFDSRERALKFLKEKKESDK